MVMHCIQNDVGAAVVRYILQKGHSRLLVQRDQVKYISNEYNFVKKYAAVNINLNFAVSVVKP